MNSHVVHVADHRMGVVDYSSSGDVSRVQLRVVF